MISAESIGHSYPTAKLTFCGDYAITYFLKINLKRR